jgi:murein DD-endopeptidase MepM/ murein hydrolase activator NlpD
VPVQGVAPSQLHDTFTESRAGGRPHDALDIMAPRGTPVLSADDGRVAKLFTSKPGGLTVYVASPDGRFMYYYAHLDRYRDGLAEGASVRKGEVLGYVGFTGDASPSAPHLHFAIARMTDPKRWWSGTPINPYLVLAPAR